MKHKNLLFNEILTKEKERPSTYEETYADRISKKIHTPQPKKVLKIVVRRKEKDDKSVINENVFYYLLKEKTIRTKKIDTKSSDLILITCMNEESAKTAKRILDAKHRHVYTTRSKKNS